MINMKLLMVIFGILGLVILGTGFFLEFNVVKMLLATTVLGFIGGKIYLILEARFEDRKP